MADASTERILVMHQTPGRIRISVPFLRGRKSSASDLARHLGVIPHVRSATLRPTTGSVIVHHEAGAVDADRLSVRIKRALADGRQTAQISPAGSVTPAPTQAAGSLRRGISSVLALGAITMLLLWKRFVMRMPPSPVWLAAAALLVGGNLFYRSLSVQTAEPIPVACLTGSPRMMKPKLIGVTRQGIEIAYSRKYQMGIV